MQRKIFITMWNFTLLGGWGCQNPKCEKFHPFFFSLLTASLIKLCRDEDQNQDIEMERLHWIVEKKLTSHKYQDLFQVSCRYFGLKPFVKTKRVRDWTEYEGERWSYTICCSSCWWGLCSSWSTSSPPSCSLYFCEALDDSPNSIFWNHFWNLNWI